MRSRRTETAVTCWYGLLHTRLNMLPLPLPALGLQDVGSKLRELSRAYRRSLVVLAASGTLSVATLMQVGGGVGG